MLSRILPFSGVVGAVALTAILAMLMSVSIRAQTVQRSAPAAGAIVLAQSGAPIVNTGIGTAEVGMASVAFPPMGPNDALRITVLGDSTGSVATNTKQTLVRIGTSPCASLEPCSSGDLVLSVGMTTASTISHQTQALVRNAGATDAQVMQTVTNAIGLNTSPAAPGTTAVETSAGGYVNINSRTATASSDAVRTLGYTVELLRAP